MAARSTVLVVGLAALVGLVGGCLAAERTAAEVDIAVSTSTGEGLVFMPSVVAAPAGVPLRLTFENVSSLPHNLTLSAPISIGTRTIVDPGSYDTIELAPLAEGAYGFVCTIHEGMAGVLDIS